MCPLVHVPPSRRSKRPGLVSSTKRNFDCLTRAAFHYVEQLSARNDKRDKPDDTQNSRSARAQSPRERRSAGGDDFRLLRILPSLIGWASEENGRTVPVVINHGFQTQRIHIHTLLISLSDVNRNTCWHPTIWVCLRSHGVYVL